MTYKGNISGAHKSFREQAVEKINACNSIEELEKVVDRECKYGIYHSKCHMHCDKCSVEQCYNDRKKLLKMYTGSGVCINKIKIENLVILMNGGTTDSKGVVSR